jgi:DNA-binding response OmpR family regulator
MKLLIVDADRNSVEMLTSWLKTLGYEVRRAYTGEQMRTEWVAQRPDIVIIDTKLPGVNALSLCHDLRSEHDALILVLTDDKDVQDEIRCLESGADDYLRKPFFPGQLLARIHAIGRRARSTIQQRPSSILQVGSILIDTMRKEVSVGGRTHRLTLIESKLLHLLALNANEVCTTEQIVNYVWGYDGASDASLVKAHICHLRQKVEPRPGNPSYILTVPGVGYTLMRRSAESNEGKDTVRSLRVASML